MLPSVNQHGSSYWHIALVTEDLYGLCDCLAKQGITISRVPGQMNYAAEETGHSDTIAFIEDLDGYKIELH
jgi:lactoylglutathione lyase